MSHGTKGETQVFMKLTCTEASMHGQCWQLTEVKQKARPHRMGQKLLFKQQAKVGEKCWSLKRHVLREQSWVTQAELFAACPAPLALP